MTMLLPLLVFGLVFVAILYGTSRKQVTVNRINRHGVAPGSAGVAVATARNQILNDADTGGALARLAARLSRSEMRVKAEKLLMQAGSPMPVGTFLLLRIFFLIGLTPLAIYWVWSHFGLATNGIVAIAFIAVALPNAPRTYVKRKARKREKEIERAMADALDLLVVCVEGGLSLDGAIQQVAQRTRGLLAFEFGRLLAEISTGMGRRDALQSLGQRSSSPSLVQLCTTVIQADKMGVSIATTLRTLADTLRNTRRQAAETQARKAPIKMLPFIVFFMLPSLFVVILGPVAIGMIGLFSATGS